nr:defensin propeptide [uncultured bacterium]
MPSTKVRAEQVRHAYEEAVGRQPRQSEARMASVFFAGGGTLQEFCLALLNRSEFIYIP